MLKFKEYICCDKLFIDTNYVFDVMFWVDTDWIKNLKGELLYINRVIAIQKEIDGEIDVFLNVGLNEEDDCTGDIDIKLFENGCEIKKQITEYLMKNINEIKYTQEDKMLNKAK